MGTKSSGGGGGKVRSAINGRYVKSGEATKHPKTTVTEKTKGSKKK